MNEIILVGNPNTGKTTLFNALTKQNKRAGNWHGLTVEQAHGSFKLLNSQALSKHSNLKIDKNSPIKVTDLPGIYSLTGTSAEEKLAIKYLKEHPKSTIINVIDSIDIAKNLTLTTELIENFSNVIVLVNEFKNFPLTEDKTLKSMLKTPVLKSNFNSKYSIKSTFYQLFSQYFNFFDNILQNSTVKKIIDYSLLKSSIKQDSHKLNILEKIFISKVFGIPAYALIIFSIFFITFGPIGSLFAQILQTIFLEYIGSFFLDFLFSTNATFWIIDLVQNGIMVGFSALLSFLPQMVLLMTCFNFLEDVGVFSYLAFSLDGFLKRIGLSGKSVFSLVLSYGCNTSAITTTRNLNTLALRKKTAFLIPYYSCSAKLPIILTLSSMLFPNNKFFYVFLVYLGGIIVSIIIAYTLKVKESLIFKFSYNQTISRQNSNSNKSLNKENPHTVQNPSQSKNPHSIKTSPHTNQTDLNKTNSFIPSPKPAGNELLMEMPRLRFPSIKKIFNDTLTLTKDFVSRFATLIVVCCVLLWFLLSFSFKLEFVGTASEISILKQICFFVKPLFAPIGLASTACLCAIIASLVAKELALSVLCVASGMSVIDSLTLSNLNLSFASGLSLLVFIFLFTPCIACMFNIKKELGTKTAIFVGLSSLLTAYISAFICYRSAQNPIFLIILFIIASLFALTRLLVVKYIKRSCVSCKNCSHKCSQATLGQ